MHSNDLDHLQAAAVRRFAVGLAELKFLVADLRLGLAIQRHEWALKYGYNPSQPRVPKGSDDGGQWVSDGTQADRMQLAGDVPTNDTPELPEKRPPTSRGRSVALKLVAKLVTNVGALAELAKANLWLQAYTAEIESYRDPPATLSELQRAVSSPAAGYDIHHIVEQASAERDGFTRELIDSQDNVVRVPRLKHQEISGWYQTKNVDFGGASPREYLSGRSWEVRRSVGLQALVDHGVLKP